METQGGGEKRTEKQKPVKIDRSIIGRIRIILDGEDGRNGISALARRVYTLDEGAEKLRAQRDKEQQIVDGMRTRSGAFIGSLQAIFTRALAKLQTTEEDLALREAEIGRQSSVVCNGIGAIEEIIDGWVKGEKQYQAAEQIQKILEKMKVFAGICETVLQSIARLQKDGEAKEMTQARELFGRNVFSLRQMVSEYADQTGKNLRWAGDIQHYFLEMITAGNFGEVKKHVEEDLFALAGKMNEFGEEIKRSLPDNLGALLINEKKEYFRAHASFEEHTDIPENNP